MAKKTFTISDFSGGVNSYIDKLDIEDNELSICQGFKIEPGVVSILGDMNPASTTVGTYTIGTGDTVGSADDIDIEPGYGLFTFSHDFNMAGEGTDAGTNCALVETNYFAMLQVSNGDKHTKIDIYDTIGHTWRVDMIDLGGSLSDAKMTSIKPCFFMADNAFRVSPGNFSQVASGGTLFAGDATGDFTAEVNPGGFEAVVTDAGFDADIAPGDTIIIGKATADTPGQEMVALITADQALTAARNMTGLFNISIDASTSGLDLVYVMPDTRWRGVVQRKNFSQTGSAGTFTEWYSSYAHPRPPVTYDASLDAGTVNTQYTMPFLVKCTGYDSGDVAAGDATVDGSIPPTLWIVYRADNTNQDATWEGASINLYCTALYDEVKQESQPNKIASAVSVAAQKSLGVGVVVNYADGDVSSGAYQVNKRVTGARIYYEDINGDPGILYQLLEIDFEQGCKKAASESFTAWFEKVSNEVAQCPTTNSHDSSALDDSTNSFLFADPPKAFTYEINTLYPSGTNTHARYKTAVIANRRLFVGNIYQSGKVNGDRMIQSPVNKFDILPEFGDFVIDVTQGDGDSIVKLEAYADRLLQYKKRTLYIINIAGAIGEEFLEAQHKNMGVENPSQTCMTEYGVAWVNSNGVYLYDGQEITDLTLNKLKRTHTTANERSKGLNINESLVPTIGYHPDNKWLIINSAADPSGSFENEAWIYDFKNASWMFSAEFSTATYFKTNTVWTHDNEMVYAIGTNDAKPLFVKYRDAGTATPAINQLIFKTKDYNLEAPSVKKKLKSVYVTYSANGNTEIQAHILYQKASATATVDSEMEEVNGGVEHYTEDDGFKTTGDAVFTVELKPTTVVTDALSFQFQLKNQDAVALATGNFKLHDISFIYRPLGVR